MSKSYGNYVGVDEAPEMMFGKMMSAMGAERMHTEKGNLYKVVLAA